MKFEEKGLVDGKYEIVTWVAAYMEFVAVRTDGLAYEVVIYPAFDAGCKVVASFDYQTAPMKQAFIDAMKLFAKTAVDRNVWEDDDYTGD